MEKRGRTRWAASMRRRPEVERAVVRAGWSIELPYISGLCCSAGATAGMASLAACSTGADTLVRPYTVRHWVEWRAVGKGAKAGWKAGRRLESLPHMSVAPHQK